MEKQAEQVYFECEGIVHAGVIVARNSNGGVDVDADGLVYHLPESVLSSKPLVQKKLRKGKNDVSRD